MLVLFTFLESKTVPNVVRFAGLILVELGLAPLYSTAGFVNLAQRNSRWGLHSKAGATNFLRRKWIVWVPLTTKKNSQYSLAVNKSSRFLVSCARSTNLKEKIQDIADKLAFPRFERFLGNICSFQQILQKKVVGCPWYESIKRFISRHAASQHVVYVVSRASVFLVGNHWHMGLYFLLQGRSQSFQFSLCFWYFSFTIWWDRFLGEYIDLAIYIS